MPTFDNVPVETTIDVEFEVYCWTCGAGLCGESKTVRSSRGYLKVMVNVCPVCMMAKDDEIENLKYELKELEKRLNND